MVRIPVDVLVVDDEPDFVELVCLRLEETGERPRGAHGGREALEELSREPADVVLLDIRMPGMDGISCLKEIRARAPLVEVLLLTGHGSVETAVEGMKLGAYDYLNKPADFQEMVEKIRAAAARKRQQEDRIRRAEARALSRRSGNMF